MPCIFSVFLFKIRELMLEVIFPYALVLLFFPYVNNIIKVEKPHLFQKKVKADQNKFCNLSQLLTGSGLLAFSIPLSPPPSVAVALCLWAEYQ